MNVKPGPSESPNRPPKSTITSLTNFIRNSQRTSHKGRVEEHLGDGAKGRQDKWTDSVAVGSKSFIESVKASLGFRVRGRDVIESGEGYPLGESSAPNKGFFEAENEDIGLENTRFWDVKTK